MSSNAWDTSDSSNPAAPPQWAVEKASASLQLGMKVPEVEQQLVAGGLSAAAATALVIKVRDGSLALRHGGSPGKPGVPTKGWDMGDSSDPAALPAWAVEKARAMLRLGISVPDVEKRLVAGGLSPGAAEAVVTRLLSRDVRAEVMLEVQERRRRLIHVILSLVVAGPFVFLVGSPYGGTIPGDYLAHRTGAIGTGLLFIWFGKGFFRLMGWILLILSCCVRVALFLA